jgi:pimeloyl-ACP methyl ester carboxylesterase
MNSRLLYIATAICLVCVISFAQDKAAPEDQTSANNERLKQALQQYPAADANKDGILTMPEAREYLAQQKGKGKVKAKSESDTSAAPAPAANNAGNPPPTFENISYGPHERNVLDFWKASSDKPTPVVVFIHGGGFVAGDKSKARDDRAIRDCLNAGASFASINYRYRTYTPIQDVLRDCARAIQFIRSKDKEWNIDKPRIAAYGGSAGAGTSLWLAFHDDLADPNNADPILRESSRIVAAGANGCQFSYDVLKWKELFGEASDRFQKGEDYAGFYGLKSLDELTQPIGQRWRTDCDMHGLISAGDAPVFVSSPLPGGDVTDRGHLLHHPRHAEAIKKRCDEIGILAIGNIPALNIKPAADQPATMTEFLLQQLGAKKSGG